MMVLWLVGIVVIGMLAMLMFARKKSYSLIDVNGDYVDLADLDYPRHPVVISTVHEKLNLKKMYSYHNLSKDLDFIVCHHKACQKVLLECLKSGDVHNEFVQIIIGSNKVQLIAESD